MASRIGLAVDAARLARSSQQYYAIVERLAEQDAELHLYDLTDGIQLLFLEYGLRHV
ncbi:hypothetical protein M6D93_18515 [Jatrophihabitans telluris]|uniref:Uncharacterized protein n=1 Tax=Jatrophihabitans telluris TaxID=2038343 RepID=A0ABY4QY65_9ACTN|nr:hypothetical protein [Jatrophihabitans telluris]UQX88258.1 hypothetical protein M6D93_18515 [Jatrophihabitans telluris]